MPAANVCRQKGLTLIETTLCVAILSLLAAISLPTMRDFINSMHVRTAVSSVSTDFQLARTAAITKNGVSVACPVSSGRCTSSGVWSNGWIVFMDANRNQQFDQGDEMLIQHGALRPTLRLTSSRGRTELRYLTDGRSAGSNMTLNLCDSSYLRARIIINNVGRVRSERVNPWVPCPS